MYQQSSGFTRDTENVFHEIQDMTVHVLCMSAKYSDMQGVLHPLMMHCLPKSFCHEQEICFQVLPCVEIQKMIIHILLYRYNSCSCRTLQMVFCITCSSALLILMLTSEFSLIMVQDIFFVIRCLNGSPI